MHFAKKVADKKDQWHMNVVDQLMNYIEQSQYEIQFNNKNATNTSKMQIILYMFDHSNVISIKSICKHITKI